MPRIEFTAQLQKHVASPGVDVAADSLKPALEVVFDANPALRGYVLDDQQAIRQHVAVWVDNRLVTDRIQWDVPLRPDSQVYVMQALSGG
ncbi:MAG: MoaD/ThiS family protein [Planctomycetaceae bacterium]|nr:MoaD/ThiS family protein [Planctomycetaceae bacterium]